MAQPENASEGPGGRGPQPRASFAQRFLAYLVDVVILWVVGVIFVVILPQQLASAIQLVIAVGYFTYLEGSPSGQTVGKRVIGIRVVDFNTSGRIDMGRALVRQIGRIASGLVCLLGYLWMLWDKDQQTWHDKIGTTHVVPVASFPVEAWPG